MNCMYIWFSFWFKREHVESSALNSWKLNIFKIIDGIISFYRNNLDGFTLREHGLDGNFHNNSTLLPYSW